MTGRSVPRVLILSALGLGALASVLSLSELSFDHDSSSLLREDATEIARQEELADTFGAEDIVLIAWPVRSVLDPGEFEVLQQLTRDLKAMDGLEETYSLASSEVPLPLDRLRAMTRDDLVDPARRARVKKALLASRVYQGTFYDPSLSVYGIATTLAPASRAAKEECLRLIRAATKRYATPERPIRVAGISALAMDAAAYAVDDLKKVGALALCVSLVVLLVLCGSLREVLAAVVATGLPPLYALGLAVFLKIPVTALGAALFPVLAVVGITSSVHLLNAYGETRRRGASLAEAILAARRRVTAPVVLSLFTTAFAFFSLQATSVPAFREGGRIVGLGLLTAAPVILLGLPALLEILRPAVHAPIALRIDRPLLALGLWVGRHRRGVLVAAASVLLASGFLIPRARTEAGVFKAFQPRSAVATTYRFLDENLTAVLPADVVLSARRNASMLDIVRDLQAFEDKLAGLEGIDDAMSLATLVRHGAAIVRLEDDIMQNPASLTLVMTVLRGDFGHVTRRFEEATPGGTERRYRIKVRVKQSADADVLAAIEKAAAEFETGNARLTGLYPRAVATARGLMKDLATGTLAMVAFIVICVTIALKSLRLGLASIVPNLLPPAVVFSGASLFGARLDVSTVAVGSVAIGLAVDDTLHLLFEIVRQRRRGRSIRSALLSAQRSIGRALVLSTAVLTAGLSCLALSMFVPTAHFGLYTAAACVVALLGDLLVLPALIRSIRAL